MIDSSCSILCIFWLFYFILCRTHRNNTTIDSPDNSKLIRTAQRLTFQSFNSIFCTVYLFINIFMETFYVLISDYGPYFVDLTLSTSVGDVSFLFPVFHILIDSTYAATNFYSVVSSECLIRFSGLFVP